LRHARRKIKPEKDEQLKAEWEACTDWRVTCRECGRVRVGTLAELRKPCAH